MSDVEEDTVTLVASDGTKCAISKDAALISPVLKAMIEGPFQENNGEVKLPNIGPQIMDKVIEYLELKYKNIQAGNFEADDIDFQVPPELSLELLLAADYLNV